MLPQSKEKHGGLYVLWVVLDDLGVFVFGQTLELIDDSVGCISSLPCILSKNPGRQMGHPLSILRHLLPLIMKYRVKE